MKSYEQIKTQTHRIYMTLRGLQHIGDRNICLLRKALFIRQIYLANIRHHFRNETSLGYLQWRDIPVPKNIYSR